MGCRGRSAFTLTKRTCWSTVHTQLQWAWSGAVGVTTAHVDLVLNWKKKTVLQWKIWKTFCIEHRQQGTGEGTSLGEGGVGNQSGRVTSMEEGGGG